MVNQAEILNRAFRLIAPQSFYRQTISDRLPLNTPAQFGGILFRLRPRATYCGGRCGGLF